MNNNTKPLLIRLIHMGDSITFGQHIDVDLRWTTIIAKRLEKEYLETPINILALNRGVSGETTRMGLERFPSDVQNLSPDILTLQFGLNDCNCWLTDGGAPRVSELAFRANLIEMIERVRLFGTKHIILADNHPTLRYKEMLNSVCFEDANARYSEIIHEVAINTGVTFCAIRKGFEQYLKRNHEITKSHLLLPYPDQLHLSVDGNQLYADIIWPLIYEKMKLFLLENTRSK